MGATSYISSGLIEAYVSGLASSNEREELELAMAQYPEVAAAYQNCQLDMEHYVSLQSVPPPTTIRERLLGRLGDEETARANGSYVDENALPEEPVQKVLVSGAWRWMAAAAILLLLIGGMLYFDLYTRYNDYKSKFEAMAVSKNAMAAEMNAYHTRMEEMDKTLQMVKDPSMKMVRMPGTKPFPAAMATVFWNQASKEVFVMVNTKESLLAYKAILRLNKFRH